MIEVQNTACADSAQITQLSAVSGSDAISVATALCAFAVLDIRSMGSE